MGQQFFNNFFYNSITNLNPFFKIILHYTLKFSCATDTENNVLSIPETFMLQQNYPNPFNPATKIVYRLAKNSPVELAVYNALGQKVATLVDERKQAGVYNVTFDGSGLPSGVYFCKLKAGAFEQTRKMLLLR